MEASSTPSAISNSSAHMRELSVSQCFLLYQSDDSRAFDALWELMVPRLKGALRKRFGNQFDDSALDDLVQESLLKAHIHRHKLVLECTRTDLQEQNSRERWDAAVAYWYIQIAKNHTLDVLRKANTEKKYLQFMAQEPDFDDELVHERIEAILAAIPSLSTGQQEIIRLHTLEEKSMAEIAALEGVQEGTIRTRASRAYSALRSVLGVKKETKS